MNRSARYLVIGITVLAIISTAILVVFNHPNHRVLASNIESGQALHPTLSFTVSANIATLPQAFASAGIAYYPEDHITAVPSPTLGIGSVITVTRALPVTVIDGNTTCVQRTWATTVGGLLTEKNILLGADDKITPALTTGLTNSTTITITRVAVTTEAIDQPIAYQTVNQNDSSLWYGQTAVTQQGQNGVLEIDHLLIRQNGSLVSDTVTGNKTISQPINEIISHGTKLNIVSSLSGKATWYGTGGSDAVAIASSTGLQYGQVIQIINHTTGLSIVVTINDSCPSNAGCSSLVDLSPQYFQQLGGTLGQGVMANIEVDVIKNP